MDSGRFTDDNAKVIDFSLNSSKRIEWLSRAAVALVPLAALASFPLVFLDHTFGGAYPFFVILPWGAGFVAFWLVIQILRERPEKRATIRFWSFECLLILYFATAAISALFSVHKSFCFAALLPLAINLLLAYAVATSFAVKWNKPTVWVWILVAAVEGAWAIWGYLHGVETAKLRGTEVAAEPVASFGNRNFLASFLAASIWMGLGLIPKRDDPRWKSRVLLFGGATLGLTAVILFCCRSRGASGLTLIIAIGMVLAWLQNFRARMIGLGAILLSGIVVLTLPSVQAKLQKWKTADTRPSIWKGTAQMILARPLTGHGWGAFVLHYPAYRDPDYFKIGRAANLTEHAHNEILEIVAEGGVLAGAAFLALMAFVAQATGRAIRRGNLFALGWLGAGTTFLLQNLVDISLHHPPNQTLFWLLIGLMVAQTRTEPATPPPLPHPLWHGAAIVGAIGVVLFGIAQPLRADLAFARGFRSKINQDLLTEIASYREATQADSNRLEAWYQLANAQGRLVLGYAQQKAFDQANAELLHCRDTYEHLQTLAPDYRDLNYNLALLYLQLGQPQRALPLLRRAIHLEPKNEKYRAFLREIESSLPKPT